MAAAHRSPGCPGCSGGKRTCPNYTGQRRTTKIGQAVPPTGGMVRREGRRPAILTGQGVDVSPLQQGHIVWAVIFDPQGKNPKRRPAVIITCTDEIQPGEPLVVATITSRLVKPLPKDHVELPWHRNGHPKTSLRKWCAAVCSWLVAIRESDIEKVGGIVPARKMLEIVDKLPKLS